MQSVERVLGNRQIGYGSATRTVSLGTDLQNLCMIKRNHDGFLRMQGFEPQIRANASC